MNDVHIPTFTNTPQLTQKNVGLAWKDKDKTILEWCNIPKTFHMEIGT